jgi:hypothetical protein
VGGSHEWDPAVDIPTGKWLDGEGSITGKGKTFLQSVQARHGAHPHSYPMRSGGALSSGANRQEREADHTPPSSEEVKNSVAITPLSYTLHSVLLVHPGVKQAI